MKNRFVNSWFIVKVQTIYEDTQLIYLYNCHKVKACASRL